MPRRKANCACLRATSLGTSCYRLRFHLWKDLGVEARALAPTGAALLPRVFFAALLREVTGAGDRAVLLPDFFAFSAGLLRRLTEPGFEVSVTFCTALTFAAIVPSVEPIDSATLTSIDLSL